MDIKTMFFNALQSAGYDLISCGELWLKFKNEVKNLKPGKYSYQIGSTQISFKK